MMTRQGRSTSGRTLGVLLVSVLAVILLFGGGAVAEQDPATVDIDDRLTAGDGNQSPPADIDPAMVDADGQVSLLVGLTSPDEPTTADQLQIHAATSQETLVQFAAESDGITVDRQFWIANTALVTVDTTATSLQDLARVEGVEHITSNDPVWTHSTQETQSRTVRTGSASPTDTGTLPVDALWRTPTSSVRQLPAADKRHNPNMEIDRMTPAGETDTVTAEWGVETVDAPAVWDTYDTQGENTSVAVLDTGVDPDHPDIDLTGWADFDRDGERLDTEPRDYDPDGHGTHVSGTVSGGNASDTYIGVAPGVDLYHGAVLRNCGGGSCTGGKTQILAGMEWAVENDVDVLSMSLGGLRYDREYATAVRNARDNGTTVVASIGNDGEETSGSPGNAYDALSVGATDKIGSVPTFSGGERILTDTAWDDPPTDWPQSYVVPSVSAPGVLVRSALPDGEYGPRLGTSMAAPHVSGTVALAQAATEEHHSPAALVDAIEASATKPSDPALPDGQRDTRYGRGIVNATATVESLQGTLTPLIRADRVDPAPGEEVTFDASGTFGPVESFAWDFTGDGDPDETGPVVTHAFEETGTHNVTLTVSDGEGTTATTTRQVAVELEAVFTVEPSVPEHGDPVTFDASGTGGEIDTFEWDLTGDGETDETGEQVTHTFETLDSHDVTLEVEDAFGNTDTATETVVLSAWTFEAGESIESSPTIVDETVFVGSYDGRIYALDSETGQEVWNASEPGRVTSSPTVTDGTVFVGSDDGTVYALDAGNGSVQWTNETSDTVGSSPTVMNDTIIVGSEDGTVSSFGADSGEREWTAATGGPVASSPTVTHDTVYVGSVDHTLYALDAENGSEVWTHETGDAVRSSPTVANRTVFVGSDDETVYALDAENGSAVWTSDVGGGVESSPTVANGTLFVGSTDGSVHALDADSGETSWSVEAGGWVASSPTVANETVFVGNFDRRLHALDADSGETVWTVETDGPVRSSPTVADGLVFVGTGSGFVGDGNSLYALSGADGFGDGTRVSQGTMGHHHVWAEGLLDGSFELAVQDEEFVLDATNAVGAIDTFEWEIGDDGVGATGEFATHPVTETGEINVTLTVTDIRGETDRTTRTVHVGPPALPGEDPPADLTGDGNFEDLSADGTVAPADVQLLFDNLDDGVVQDHAQFYDFSGTNETEVTIFDVQALFNRIGTVG